MYEPSRSHRVVHGIEPSKAFTVRSSAPFLCPTWLLALSHFHDAEMGSPIQIRSLAWFCHRSDDNIRSKNKKGSGNAFFGSI